MGQSLVRRAFSTIGRPAAVGCVVALLTGCGHQSPTEGSDIRFVGAAAGSDLFPAKFHPGEVLGFAMPQMKNVASVPITIQSFRLTHVPRGATVETFKLLSARDTDGVLLGSFPANAGGRDGYGDYTDYLPQHPKIRPNRVSLYYPVLFIRVNTPSNEIASGCVYEYRIGGAQREETAPCRLHLEELTH